MNVIGIIAEYNPFHNGHAYQIKKIKEQYPDSIVIVIISTCFTERGDISIINKWNKAQIALNNGVDLIIELPTLYTIQSADIFAKCAVKILNEFKINILAFGTETDNIEILKTSANIQLNNKEYNLLVDTYLNNGLNYPTATSKALEDITKIKIDKPNDLLGLSYIKEIIKNNYNITPISIKRTNGYHDNIPNDIYLSANAIRERLLNKEDIEKYIVKDEINYLYQDISLESLYPLLKYKIITEHNLKEYPLVSEGIENRIIKYIKDSVSWKDLVNKIKTKRYTYNRINRILLQIVLNIKEDYTCDNPYTRILGFNNNGRTYLNRIKKEINIAIYNKYKPNLNKIFDIEATSTYIYSFIVKDNNLIQREYQNKPIIF